MISYSEDVLSRAIAQAAGISRQEEGDVLTAYPDPGTNAAPWTIGYGSTRIFGRPVRQSDVITEEQAVAQMNIDLTGSMNIVLSAVTVPLNGDQLGALTSFVNNVGPGRAGVKDGLIELKSGGPSTLLRLVNAGMFAAAAAQFPLWDMAAGKALPGLKIRRFMEQHVFLGKLDMTDTAAA